MKYMILKYHEIFLYYSHVYQDIIDWFETTNKSFVDSKWIHSRCCDK